MKKLSDKEAQVLRLSKHEFLGTKAISIRLGLTERRVRAIKQGIAKKNIKTIPLFLPPVSTSGIENKSCASDGTWRYHALHFIVKPYYFYPRYQKIRQEKGNYGIGHRDWVVKLHPDMLEVQLKVDADFASKDKFEATRKAQASFERILAELSNKYGFEAWKDGKANIRLVNQHLALNGSTLAKEHRAYLQIEGHDGKIWFTIDNSKGFEHEYRHPERAVSDSERIEPYLNDMLQKQPPTMSELAVVLKQVIEQNKETAAGLSIIIKLLGVTAQEEYIPPTTERPSYIG